MRPLNQQDIAFNEFLITKKALPNIYEKIT
jgi:hypothetical protein